MEEIKEKSAKKPVSMRLTATASERLMHIIDLYKNLEDPKGEQQENAILRILDIAESDNIRGTHPELEGPLLAVEATISTLIKQLNGIAVWPGCPKFLGFRKHKCCDYRKRTGYCKGPN